MLDYRGYLNRSQGMEQKVDHICDRVDLMYNKETGR